MRIICTFAIWCALSPVIAIGAAPVRQACAAPSYFGICNPYVPGVFIGRVVDGAIPVFSTWHDGPAEKAGVCPGDRIVAVNGVSPTVGWDAVLHQLVSAKPAPVLLKVRRGTKVFEVRIPRVRETTLAALSGEKFGRMLTPSYATNGDVESVEKFRVRLYSRAGFKMVGDMEVPEHNPEKQVEELEDMLENTERAIKAFVVQPNTYSGGFNLVVLKDPFQVVVARVLPGSPAQSVGLWVGDEVVTINQVAVASIPLDRIQELLSKRGTLVVGVRRDGNVRNLTLNTQPVSDFVQPDKPIPSSTPLKAETYIIGFTLLWDDQTHRAVIESVRFPSPAFAARLHPGSEIIALNDKAMDSTAREQVARMLSPSDATPMSLKIVRKGKQQRVRLVPVRYKDALAGIGRKLTKFGPAPLSCPD